MNNPSRKVKRISTACDVCRRRKAKCDEGHPCSFCHENGFTCSYTVIQRTVERLTQKDPNWDPPNARKFDTSVQPIQSSENHHEGDLGASWHTPNPLTDLVEDISSEQTVHSDEAGILQSSKTTSFSTSKLRRVLRRLRPCYIFILLSMLTIACSLIPAIWCSIENKDIQGGFSIAQYILGVGVLIIGCGVAIHSRTCKCWGAMVTPAESRLRDTVELGELAD